MARHKIRRDDLAARMGRPSRRPRRPLAIGFVLVGLAGWIVLRSEALRGQVLSAAHALAGRVSAAWSGWQGNGESDRERPVAFTAAEPMPIEAPAYSDKRTAGATGYPAGFGIETAEVPAPSEIGPAD
jgi:hypothetical protein